MKTFIVSLLFAVAVLSASAQDAAHLTFKGVPIDGTLNEFVAKMKASGFTQIGTQDGTAILKGDFAGYKDCTIGVSTLKGKDLVSSITVLFPEKDTWESLAGDYFHIKELLSEKYGDHSESTETFNSKYEPDDDFSKMHLVKMNDCQYYSTFETKAGKIQLAIDHQDVRSCYVRLSYYDKINSQIIREKALGDL